MDECQVHFHDYLKDADDFALGDNLAFHGFQQCRLVQPFLHVERKRWFKRRPKLSADFNLPAKRGGIHSLDVFLHHAAC